MRPRILSHPILLGATRDEQGRQITEHTEPVRDCEAFLRRILDNALERWGMFITDEEYEDAFYDLLEQALRLERRFNPGRSPSFAGYAAYILNRRVVDAGPRRILGRSGFRIPERSHETLDEHTPPGTRPWEPHTQEQSDPHPDRAAHDRGLPGDRDRRTAWADTILGLRAA